MSNDAVTRLRTFVQTQPARELLSVETLAAGLGIPRFQVREILATYRVKEAWLAADAFIARDILKALPEDSTINQ